LGLRWDNLELLIIACKNRSFVRGLKYLIQGESITGWLIRNKLAKRKERGRKGKRRD